MIEETRDYDAPQVEDFDLFSMAFSSAAIGMALVAVDGRFINVNEAMCRITGFSRSELLTRDFQTITHPADLDADVALVQELLAGRRKSYQMEKRYIRKDGGIAWARLTGSLARRPSGEPWIFIAQVEDIAAQKQVEGELASFFSLCSDLLAIATPDGVLARVNPAWQETLGWTSAELDGMPITALLHPDDVARTFDEFKRIASRGKSDVHWVNRYRHKNGSYRWLEWTTSMRPDGSFLGAARDITAQRLDTERMRRQKQRLEEYNRQISNAFQQLRQVNSELEISREKLEYLAWHDSLTGLGNRNRFNDQLEKTIEISARKGDEFALLFMDLNGFKDINDTFGHAAGDAVLREVANRLRSNLSDAGNSYRLGGDEFAVLLTPGTTDQDDSAMAAAHKIARALERPIRFKGHERGILCSIGIALFPHHAEDADMLVRKADAAMYEAKSSGTSPTMASDFSATTVLRNLSPQPKPK